MLTPIKDRDGYALVLDVNLRNDGKKIDTLKLLHEGDVQPFTYTSDQLYLEYDGFHKNDIIKTFTITREVETTHKAPRLRLLSDMIVIPGIRRTAPNDGSWPFAAPLASVQKVLLVTHVPDRLLTDIQEKLLGKFTGGIGKGDLSLEDCCTTIRLATTCKVYQSRLKNDEEWHAVNAEVVHSGVYLVWLRFRVQDRVVEEGWKHGSLLRFVLFPDRNDDAPRGTGRIIKSTIDAENKAHIIDMRILKCSDLLVYMEVHAGSTVPIEVWLDSEINTSDPLSAAAMKVKGTGFKKGSVGAAIIQQIYSETREIPTNPLIFEEASPEILDTPSTARIKDADGTSCRTLRLDHEQRAVIAADANKDNIILNLDAGAGTGKTTTIVAAIVAQIRRAQEKRSGSKRPLILAVAVTNAAVGQLAHTLLKFADCDPEEVIRLVNVTNETDIRTPVDLYRLLGAMIEDKQDPLKIPQNHEEYALYPKALRKVMKTRIDSADINDLGDEARASHEASLNFLAEVNGWGRRIVLDRRPPVVICATISTLLNTLNAGELESFFKKKQVTVWVDEASQLPESALFALAQKLPNARQRFVGDPMQLQPYCESGDKYSKELASRGISSLLVHSPGVPRLTLRICRRLHPGMLSIVSRFFYNRTMKDGADINSRSQLTAAFPFPIRETPFAMINVAGQHEYREGSSSLSNPLEAAYAVHLVTALSAIIKPQNQIAVICIYLDQRALVRSLCKKAGLNDVVVTTVDSSQGKEWEAVVVLTTKTSNDASFVSNRCRANVALSRAKQGTFVIGNVKWLRTESRFWKGIENHVRVKGMVIEEKTARKLFSAKGLAIRESEVAAAPESVPAPRAPTPEEDLPEIAALSPTSPIMDSSEEETMSDDYDDQPKYEESFETEDEDELAAPMAELRVREVAPIGKRREPLLTITPVDCTITQHDPTTIRLVKTGKDCRLFYKVSPPHGEDESYFIDNPTGFLINVKCFNVTYLGAWPPKERSYLKIEFGPVESEILSVEEAIKISSRSHYRRIEIKFE